MADNEEWVEKIIEECARNASDRKMNETETFKAVTKSIVRDAAKVLDETGALWELEPDSKELREKFHLLEHYLSYLFRFCEGKV